MNLKNSISSSILKNKTSQAVSPCRNSKIMQFSASTLEIVGAELWASLVSMALCPHMMRGEALGLHAPNTAAPWDWEEDMLSQPIQDGGPQLAASSFLPWWHELKLYERRIATEVSESRVTFWCEEGQDAAVSWPRAGQQGGGNVSIMWISTKPHGTMCVQTHWARRRRRHGCCTRASQKALNVFLFEKQRVLVKNNIWLSIPHTASLNFQYNTYPPNPEWKLTVWPEELV